MNAFLNYLRQFTDVRAYLRGLAKNSLRAGTGAILLVFGTNGAEKLAPELLSSVSLNWKQALAVFAASAFLEAIRYIHQSTINKE